MWKINSITQARISGVHFLVVGAMFNPFSAGTAFILMQTGWIQASCRDPTCLLLSPSFPIKNKQNLKVLKSRRQYNLFLENYPAFKGLKSEVLSFFHSYIRKWFWIVTKVSTTSNDWSLTVHREYFEPWQAKYHYYPTRAINFILNKHAWIW